MSTYGGLVWIKGRNAASNHILTDTVRGPGNTATDNQAISSNLTAAQDLNGAAYDFLDTFTTTGFRPKQGGTTPATRGTNYNAVDYVSWSFRKYEKFFDIVAYTGTGVNRTIAHNLGSVPGCIFVKKLSSSADWPVYHRSLTNTEFLQLNKNGAKDNSVNTWNSTTPTASVFSVGTNSDVNENGDSYIAYLFAHNAGGFGASFTDNVISCGAFTTGGAGTATVTLGYEPQFILIKSSTANEDWGMWDASRSSLSQVLYANLPNVEAASSAIVTSGTGF